MKSITVAEPVPNPAPTPHATDGRRLSRVMVVILVAYVAFILVLMVVRGAYMSPDLFIVLGLVIVVVMGRTRLFLREWLPFAAVFLGWESMRGPADELGATVPSTDVIALERFFRAGNIPSEVLQADADVDRQRHSRRYAEAVHESWRGLPDPRPTSR